METRENEIMKKEQELRDKIEKDLEKEQRDNVKVRVKDIKLVGDASWRDKINGNDLKKEVFLVEKEIVEIDENGKERKVEKESYYLDDECIGGKLGDTVVFSERFKMLEEDKMKAVEKLLDYIDENDLDEYSLNKLEDKELIEVLEKCYGREISKEELNELKKELGENNKENSKEEYNEEKVDEKEDKEDNEPNEKEDKNKLSKNQAEYVRANSIQKVELSTKVDGKETLGERLDLKDYEILYTVRTDTVKNIDDTSKIYNTKYTLVGMRSDGTVNVLNDEFEIDKSVGNSPDEKETKIRENETASIDIKDVSVYTRKSNGASIGCEDYQGKTSMFFYEKTLQDNKNVGIQIEARNTKNIPVETKEILNRQNGLNQPEKVKDEIEEHIDEGHNPEDIKDYDGKEETETHVHEQTLDDYVQQVLNYTNDNGDEKIREVFTDNEVRDKILNELSENQDILTPEEVIEKVQVEMNEDAENLSRDHNLDHRL